MSERRTDNLETTLHHSLTRAEAGDLAARFAVAPILSPEDPARTIVEAPRPAVCAPIEPLDGHTPSIPEALDNPATLQRLQRQYVATKYVKNWFEMPDLTPMEKEQRFLGHGRRVPAERISSQFAARVLPVLMVPDKNTALEAFRRITPSTDDELLVTLTNDREFAELHNGLQEYLTAREGHIDEEAAINQARIRSIDRTQFPEQPTHRTLEAMRQNGMTLKIRPDALELLRDTNITASDDRPLIERLKNERILNINGLDESKVSLAVHDFMDHMWTFALIQDKGLLNKYAEMFASIGDPQDFDIFKREGEIVASIAYGVREYETVRPGFEPLVDTTQIHEHLDSLFAKGELDMSRHADALRILKALRPGSLEWQSLGFVFSSYMVELDEQRRKHGAIKQRDLHTGELLGELDPYSPDFLCFLIETHHQIIKPKNFHYNDLARFQILLEDYLVNVASGRLHDTAKLNIKLSDLRNMDLSGVQISAGRIRWIREHYGFATTRYNVV